MTELLRALAAYCEAPTPAVARALELPASTAAEHAALFLFQLYPHASVYLGAEGMLGGEAGDRAAGFWRAVGLEPPADADHLAGLLGLYAAFAEEGEPARHPRRALLWEHLLSWLPAWLARVEEVASEAYQCWSRLLRAALVAEAEEMGRPEARPVPLRSSPAPERIVDVLAAGRSGVILARADLVRAAGDLGLGLGQGERRRMLEDLLAQESRPVASWLAGECRRQARVQRSQPVAWRPVTEEWSARAERMAAWLERLAAGSVRASGGEADS